MSSTMTLRLDDETRHRLDRLARSTGLSRASLVRQAILSFLEVSEWQSQAIRRAVEEADRASADDFVAHDEVAAWLDSWGTEAELDPPR